MAQADPEDAGHQAPAASGSAPGAGTPPASSGSARLGWAGVARWVAAIPAALKSVTVGLGVALAVLVAFAEFTGQRVVIEPFEVSARLRDDGYTSRAIANKLIDQITAIRMTARTSMRRRQFVAPPTDAAPPILVFGSGLSVDSLFQYVRELLGREPVRIIGEIISLPRGAGAEPEVRLTARVRGKPPKTVSGPLGGMDGLLHQAAEHIILHTQPYVLASYLYEVDPSRCREVIRFVLQNDPPSDDARAYNLWGLLTRDAGDHARAVELFQEAVRVAEDSDIRARAYTNQAASLHALGRPAEALEAIRKAIEADAAHPEAYHVWGLVLAGMVSEPGAGDGPAVEKFRQAISVDPRFAPAYYSLGDALAKQNDLESAIQAYRQGLDLDRGSAERHVRLARLLLLAKREEEALRYLRRAIELDPASYEAQNALGVALLRQGDLPGAFEQLTRAKALAPREASPHFNLGLIYRLGGEPRKAVQEFQAVLRLAPQGPEADRARRLVEELTPRSSQAR